MKKGVGQVLSSLEGHAHELDRELRQVDADIELNRVMERKYGDLFQPGIYHLQKLARTREDKLAKVIGQVEGWRTSISQGRELLDTLEDKASVSDPRYAHADVPLGNGTAINVERNMSSPGQGIMKEHQDLIGPFRVVTTSPILVN